MQLYRSDRPEDGTAKTFPIFTAIIAVDKGVVTVRALSFIRDLCFDGRGGVLYS